MVSHASKVKGYRGEVNALVALTKLGFSGLSRTGSVNYTESAPDLVQWGRKNAGNQKTKPIRIVTTQDDYGPVLITMSAADLGDVLYHVQVGGDLRDLPVVCQCKKHKKTWIGRLWRELKEAS